MTAGRGAAGGAPAPDGVPPPEPLPAEALDSHCHLEMIERPVAEVMAEARAAGITRAVTIGTDLAVLHLGGAVRVRASRRLRGGRGPPQRDRGGGVLPGAA